MVTTYIIEVPCSCCGKTRQVKLKGYCSGSCKVKAFRDKDKEEKPLKQLTKNFDITQTVEHPVGKTNIPFKDAFSDDKKEGYHYSAMLGKYIKD